MKIKDMKQPLKVIIDGTRATVERSHYVRAKTKQLQEFGYSNLKESEVDEQLTAALAGKTLKDGLTVIGGFIEGDIDK